MTADIIEGLIAIAKNNSLEETKRREALLKLKDYSDPRVIETLVELFDDKQVSIRYFAKKIYNQINKKQSAHKSINQLKKRTSIYEKLPPGQRVAEIKKAMEKATNRKEVASLIIELGKTQDPTAAPILKKYLESEWDRWRANAVEALEMIPGKEFLPWVMDLKNDHDNRTRGNVAKYLWVKGEENEAISILQDMIKSDYSWMKDSAIFVLKFIGNKRAISILELALTDLNEEIRTKALKAIEEIEKKLAEENQKKMESTKKHSNRPKIISSSKKDPLSNSPTQKDKSGGLLDKLKNLWKG